METTGQKEVSLVDPDSRLMRVDSQKLDVGYNIQTSVDAKQHLIVDYDVISNSTDHHQLATDAKAAKQMLGVDRLEVLSDKGFYVANDLVECEEAGITVFMPIPAFNPTKNVGVPEPEFCSDKFVYHVSEMLMFVLSVASWSFWGVVIGEKSNVGVVFTGRNSVGLVLSGAGALETSAADACSGRNIKTLWIG